MKKGVTGIMKDLKNKNVLITGAGSGIGRLMARGFAAEKANCALVDVNGKGLEETAALAEKQGTRIKTYICDISDKKKVSSVAQEIRKDFGGVDVLINNAGTITGKSFLDLSIEEMERTMAINYWGHLYFTKEFIHDMVKQGKGNIVNVASSSGLLGMPILSDYAASKFAEVGLSEALRREMKKFGHRGVKITCVCPYIIDTGMFKGFKPFLFSPFIKPATAAKKIIGAVKKDKPYVMMPPHSIYTMMAMRLLPTDIFDALLNVFGSGRAMDNFTGRSN
ncbi:MAG: short-chain dehydrogenase [Spirochaetae bacterium HGW-Spirochaetae-1]|jgi:all-trans-retinol dehydrogenase (NAD+)|nr:MAG: short-chain dehydrogenase [Spirochaetae bacterium HGW-Spirochaetae-1]